jgi:Tol biopolymer transport system component
MIRSSVETCDISTGRTSVIWQTPDLVEAPNWSRDGRSLIINGDGLIFRLGLDGKTGPERIDTGFAVNCNNDHGLSPDGSLLAISDKTENGQSTIYLLPASGGTPVLRTPVNPSYWHGWSPDGATLAYCAQRDGRFDIHTIPVTGGNETRLTHGEGHNDGPDYSPDGTWIYFNSSRSGTHQIWRIRPDGTGVERLTHDGFADWFPHPSPDGRHVLMVSYDSDVPDHPRDRNVRLRLMNPDGSGLRDLFPLFGGQGSINVPNWSPDGKAFAFVRYHPV